MRRLMPTRCCAACAKSRRLPPFHLLQSKHQNLRQSRLQNRRLKDAPSKTTAKTQDNQRELERLLHDAISTSDSSARQPAPTDDFQWYYSLVYQALYDAWQQPGMLSRSAGMPQQY